MWGSLQAEADEHRTVSPPAPRDYRPGIKTLEILGRPGQYEYLEKITKRLIDGILAAGREAGHEICGGNISGEQGVVGTTGLPGAACVAQGERRRFIS